MSSAGARAAMAIFLLAVLSAPRVAAAAAAVRSHGVMDVGGGGCQPSGTLTGRSGRCDRSNSPDCCVDGARYPQFLCSPPVVPPAATWAVLTLNSFREGKDGGEPSECDGAFHADSEMVVALSTGWFAGGSRCGRRVRITAAAAAAGGASVVATVVDECDSVDGCDEEHNYEAPCAYNVVDASPAVWEALGLDRSTGLQDVTWSDE